MSNSSLTDKPKRVRKRLNDPPAIDEPHDPVLAYAESVLRGDEIAGPLVRAACSRHIKDLEHGHIRGLRWDLAAAKRVIAYFRTVLRLSKGQFQGQPFILHPSQQFIVGSWEGWKRADGTRRFRRLYIEMGKGSGKSPMAAGIGLYGLTADGEPGAEIYSAGSTKDQAAVLFKDAVAMVKQSASLTKHVKAAGAAGNEWKLTRLKDGSEFRPVSREVRKHGSGPRPHMALVDEVHEHTDGHTISMLEAGFKSRRQPLLAMFTNSGTDRNSICWVEHEHARKVAIGEIENDEAFSYIASLDEGDDPLNDPKCWRKPNPLLGTTITEKWLASRVQQAREIPAKINDILRLHFCIWTDAVTAWISRKVWEECEDPTLRLEDFEGKRCFAGLDLSETKDLTAKALVFEDGFTEDNKPKFVAFCHGYTPQATLLAREEADQVPYSLWVREKVITATPGPVIRFDYVAFDLVQDSQRFDLARVAYDRHLWSRFEEALSELGATLPCIEHAQGWEKRRGCAPDCDQRHEHKPEPLWMPGSVNALEQLILERRIRFHINPALRSAVAAARFVTSPAGLRRFDKASPGGRIDLCMALVMAVGAAVGAAPPDVGYVTEDLLVIA